MNFSIFTRSINLAGYNSDINLFNMDNKRTKNIDEYIKRFPTEVQFFLEQIRETIKEVAPDAEEAISYSMPAFTFAKRYLVYFAAYKNHIGLYALPSGNEAFEEELSGFKTGKGSIQFPLDKPMPLDLIREIVRFRLKENLEKDAKR